MTTTTQLRNAPVQTRSKTRLEQILDAARSALAEVGRDRLTTAMVVERAGCSIGTFYRYFEDRIAVLDVIQPVHPHGVDALLEIHKPLELVKRHPYGTYADTVAPSVWACRHCCTRDGGEIQTDECLTGHYHTDDQADRCSTVQALVYGAAQ